MKVMDRHLAREVVRFALIALTSVVVIYLLVDLFEELNYFTSRKATVFNVLLYYLYSLPSAITLLYPVSCLLGVFLVYGQMVRHRELHALESSGVSAIRLFMPAVGVGLASVVIYLVGHEFVTIPANTEGVVRLPAQSVDDVVEQDQPLSQVEGIREIRQDGETVILTVGSGHYHFRTKMG